MAHSTLSTAREIQIKRKDFNALCSMVHSLAGIKLNEAKSELVRARLSKRMRSLDIYDLGKYLRYIEEDRTQAELISMLDSLSTNLTSFFRERDHFIFLKKTILPEIVKRAEKEKSYELRVWSAGCSTGEEPYTLALCILEYLPHWQQYNTKILATDISTRVLETAQRGVYTKERVRTVPAAMLQRHFSRLPDKERKIYTVGEQMKSIIRFRRLNLMERWPMKCKFDFIFCRNTMIYFDKPTQTKLVGRFYDQLKSGGYLIVGHSESLTGMTHRFKYTKPTIYRKA